MLANDFSCILGKISMPAPDLVAVRTARWNQAEKDDGWLQGSPELVIEVASPSNRRLQRKAALYLENGAQQVWIVYRKTQTVTVVTKKGTTDAHLGGTIEFQGVRVALSDIFLPK